MQVFSFDNEFHGDMRMAFKTLLKNRQLLIAVGVISLILLIWVGGHWLGWSSNFRLMLMLIVLLSWSCILLLASIRASHNANMIERSIETQADQHMQSVKASKKPEVEQLKQKLTQAILALKKSKLGKSGHSALYALPWYIIIGPPGIGKTTALRNSGLELPSGADKLTGVGGTRNCDWFLTSSAILLDTAGRYMTEEQDAEEWLGFLDVLKKYRKRQPINGVIVGVSIADLSKSSPEEVEQHAVRIRRRINELIRRLGLRFPVYLVFTKCDLLQGFVDFFGEYDRLQREQIWGCTFSVDQIERKDNQEKFEAEFDLLYNALIRQRTRRLSVPLTREKRKSIFVFPLELKAAKQNLSHFVAILFQNDPFEDNPIFRGFYLTSGTQEGVPIDVAIQAIARQFDLPADLMAPFAPEIKTKSYFIKNLFTDVIIPDKNIVSESSAAAKRQRWVSMAAAVLSLLGLLVFVIGSLHAYFDARFALNNLSAAMHRVEAITSAELSAENIVEFDMLWKGLRQQENRAISPLSWGFNIASSTLASAQELHFNKMEQLLRKTAFRELQQNLHSVAYDLGPTSGSAYNDLQLYLLLGKEYTRLDTLYQKFAANQLETILDRGTDRYAVRSNEAERVQGPWRRSLRYFISMAAKKARPIIDNDNILIERVRTRIATIPNAAALLDQIENRYEGDVTPITLDQIAGQRAFEIFELDSVSSSGFYTKDAWDNVVQKAISEACEKAGQGDWVLGITPDKLPQYMRDVKEIRKIMERVYFDRYRQFWENYVRNIRYKQCTSISAAAMAMELLGDGDYSPLAAFINNLTKQTKFSDPVASAATRAVKSFAKRLPLGATIESQAFVSPEQEIERHFSSLHVFSATNAPNEKLSLILNGYSGIARSLRELQKGPLENFKVYAEDVLRNSGKIPEAAQILENQLANLRVPYVKERLFAAPLEGCWQTVLGEAAGQLNSQWQKSVYDRFNQVLAKCYPFNKNGADAPLPDFEEFFTPTGTLWTFLQTAMKGFVQIDEITQQIRILTPVNLNGGLQVSQEFKENMTRALLIQKRLFNRDRIEIAFSICYDKRNFPVWQQARSLLPQIEEVDLYIGSEPYRYRFGEPTANFYSWPMEGAPKAKLEILTRDQQKFSLQCDDVWAFIKLLEKAEVRQYQSEPTKYSVVWRVPYKLSPNNPAVVHYILDARKYDNAIDPRAREEMFDFRLTATIN